MKYCVVSSSSGLLAMVTYSLLLLSLIISAADAFASVKSTAAVSSPQHKSYSSSSQSVGSTTTCLSATVTVAAPTYTLFGLNIKKSIQKKKSHKKQLFTIPSIFNSDDSRPIILFDGKCNLCNGGVQLILDNDAASLDPRGNLRVAALQSRVGQILLSRLPRRDQAKVITLDNNNDNSNNNKSNEFKSIVVIGPNSQYWLNSSAYGYESNGLCSVGLVGTVSRVLEQRAYPKSVAVQFDNVDCGVGSGEGDSSDDGNGGEGGASLSFEAHFYPGQLRKE
ncbi:hypothetical protein ACHAWC_000778 [Mediolabrus comicus]